MNRRGMFKKVMALGVALPFAPVAWKAVHAKDSFGNRVWQTGIYDSPVCNAPCTGSYSYQPPPPVLDTRSPEQVVVDSRVERIRYTAQDLTRDYPGRQRFHYQTDASTWAGVAHRLGTDGTPFEVRDIFSVVSIICNGNVLSIV